MISILAIFFALLLTGAASQFVTEYKNGPITLDSIATFSFTVDEDARTASFGLIVTTEVTEETWVGIGISEPTSGSMLGADIATVQFENDSDDECELTDRHVPFAAFPLLQSAGGAPPVFPDRDECQGGWDLVSCTRDAENGIITLEVTRSLDAEDPQDREIVPGVNNVIYAFGSSFMYHSGNRASVRVSLFGSDQAGTIDPPLPSDVTSNMTFTATNYSVSEQKATVYACTSTKIPLEEGETKMIVAIDPLINATKEEHVHHLTLFLCRSAEYAKLIEETIECTTGDEIPGPIGSNAGCATFIYGWAKGVQRLVLPAEAGFLVDAENSYLVLETHYDNPELESDAFDNSGVVLHFADTLRDNEAGSLLIGDSFVQLQGEQIESGFKYQFTCPSECTEKFSEPVNLFSSFLHMHRTGMAIANNKFNKRDRFIENVNQVNFWSDSFQNQVAIDKRLRPGDQLSISCIYDTRKLPQTRFGLQTEDEMCMDFVGYWPLQREAETNEPINLCAFARNENATSTFCGDFGGEPGTGLMLLPVPNPKFEDNVGAQTSFGNTPDQCPAETDEPSMQTPTPEPGSPGTDGGVTPVDTDGGENGDEDDGGGTALPDTEDEGVCFPASARVTTREGKKRMNELVIGDEVLVKSGVYSPVFMFTHRTGSVRYMFLKVSTESLSITLTRGHYLYVNGKLAMAESVRVGDTVIEWDGGDGKVTKVERLWDNGLYNPQTISGDIVVDGIVASCYTVRVEPEIAHALLAPLRWAFWAIGERSWGIGVA